MLVHSNPDRLDELLRCQMEFVLAHTIEQRTNRLLKHFGRLRMLIILQEKLYSMLLVDGHRRIVRPQHFKQIEGVNVTSWKRSACQHTANRGVAGNVKYGTCPCAANLLNVVCFVDDKEKPNPPLQKQRANTVNVALQRLKCRQEEFGH